MLERLCDDQAARMGCSVHAISADMNDPLVQAIHRLIDHAVAADARLQALIDQLPRGGVPCDDVRGLPTASIRTD